MAVVFEITTAIAGGGGGESAVVAVFRKEADKVRYIQGRRRDGPEAPLTTVDEDEEIWE